MYCHIGLPTTLLAYVSFFVMAYAAPTSTSGTTTQVQIPMTHHINAPLRTIPNADHIPPPILLHPGVNPSFDDALSDEDTLHPNPHLHLHPVPDPNTDHGAYINPPTRSKQLDYYKEEPILSPPCSESCELRSVDPRAGPRGVHLWCRWLDPNRFGMSGQSGQFCVREED